jgi:hypothetical protein
MGALFLLVLELQGLFGKLKLYHIDFLMEAVKAGKL